MEPDERRAFERRVDVGGSGRGFEHVQRTERLVTDHCNTTVTEDDAFREAPIARRASRWAATEIEETRPRFTRDPRHVARRTRDGTNESVGVAVFGEPRDGV